MKKILIIIGKLYIGGAERVGRDIGYYANPDQYEIHYLVFGDDIGIYERGLSEKGCRIIHVASPSAGYISYYRTLINLIRKEKYDVIHSHTMFSSAWAMMAGKKYGVPIRIAHSHSICGNEKRGFVKNIYENIMRSLILCYATHYVGCGKGAGSWLFGENTFRKKGILIYNGISLDRFVYDTDIRQQLRTEAALEDRFVIGHAGHLAAVKNQHFLLDLMPKILKKKPNAFLLLLGEGSDRLALEAHIQSSGLQDYVRLMGNVSNVNEWLSAMDVFAFPSLYEGMPLALMEAQANGLPCVISTKIPDDVHQTDLVIPLDLGAGEDCWADAICAARRQAPERYAGIMRELGFDTDGMLKKIYALYEG